MALLVAGNVIAVVVAAADAVEAELARPSTFGEVGGAEEDEVDEADEEEVDEANESDDEFFDDVVEDTFLAVSAALFLTIRFIDETEGRLSSSQIPSDWSWFLISQANMVGFAFL